MLFTKASKVRKESDVEKGRPGQCKMAKLNEE
jgi:hypothetical protein